MSARTKYVVLEEMPEDSALPEAWTVYAENIEAASPVSALRVALDGKGNLGTRYVAVPQRSWQPQPVQVETSHRIKIG